MSSHQFLFYCAGATAESPSVEFRGDEHHHVARVLRSDPGDILLVTNGSGLVLECRVTRVGDGSTSADVVAVRSREREPRGLLLALAIMRRDRFEQAFEQCVELGITACVPFSARGSKAGEFGSRSTARLRRIAVSAIKQSFRAWLPVVLPAATFETLVDRARATPHVIVGAVDGPPLRPCAGGGDVLAIVGPEAGLTAEECAALEGAGAVFASVSTHRLRSETAAVALVSALRRDN